MQSQTAKEEPICNSMYHLLFCVMETIEYVKFPSHVHFQPRWLYFLLMFIISSVLVLLVGLLFMKYDSAGARWFAGFVAVLIPAEAVFCYLNYRHHVRVYKGTRQLRMVELFSRTIDIGAITRVEPYRRWTIVAPVICVRIYLAGKTRPLIVSVENETVEAFVELLKSLNPKIQTTAIPPK